VFYKTLLGFLSDLSPLIPNTLYPETVESIANFFETFFRHLMDLCHDPQYSDRQQLLILVDIYFLSHHVFPSLRSVLTAEPLPPVTFSNSKSSSQAILSNKTAPAIFRFGRPIPELDKLQRRLMALFNIVQSSFFQRRARKLAGDTFAFGPASINSKGTNERKRRTTTQSIGTAGFGTGFWMDYSSDAYPMHEQSLPSDAMTRCVKDLHQLALLCHDILRPFPSDKRPFETTTIIKGVIDSFFADLTEGTALPLILDS
jgi:hypothetical protein